MGFGDHTEVDAPFNMAIATLRRLDAILIRIRILDDAYAFDSPEKQKSLIGLVKHFFINSTPLLKEEDVAAYKEKILPIDLKTSSKIKSGVQSVIYIYDPELDIKLNGILIELQTKLKRFFMPKGKDPASAIIDY